MQGGNIFSVLATATSKVTYVSDMARIKIVLGTLQLEYEGEQDFIESRLIGLAEKILALRVPPATHDASTVQEQRPQSPAKEVSTNTIAQLISAKTGSDLALAAIARINLIKKNSTASRSDILDEMKEATTYFKESYGSNLTSYLDTLVRGKKINLVSRSNYALSAAERSRLESALAIDA